MSKKKLPAGVTYTPANGGMYVLWDGRPEGPVWVCFDRADIDDDPAAGDRWQHTPFQGADGSCMRNKVVRMAADYVRRNSG